MVHLKGPQRARPIRTEAAVAPRERGVWQKATRNAIDVPSWRF
jgi:hypothetical protein